MSRFIEYTVITSCISFHSIINLKLSSRSRSIPNGIFKRIKTDDTISVWTVMTSISGNAANIFGYVDICKLIFGVFVW